MKKALLYIVSSIVDNPKKVKIAEIEEEGFTNFSISLAKEDIGKVIGKEGKIIRAIRNVIKIPAIKNGKKINISIEEESETPQ